MEDAEMMIIQTQTHLVLDELEVAGELVLAPARHVAPHTRPVVEGVAATYIMVSKASDSCAAAAPCIARRLPALTCLL